MSTNLHTKNEKKARIPLPHIYFMLLLNRKASLEIFLQKKRLKRAILYKQRIIIKEQFE